MVIEVALAIVAFGCARWGSEAVVWLSGVSIPVAAAIAVALLDANVLYDALNTAGVRVLAGRAYDGTNGWRVPAGLLGTALLMAPWLLGLALRFSARLPGLTRLPGRGRGRARPGRGDRPAARGPGQARSRRARRRGPLARGDPGPGGVGAVPRRRRHRGAQADDGEHRHLGPHLARRRPHACSPPRRERAPRRRGSPTWRACSTASARVGTASSRPSSGPRSRCRPSSRWWPSGCSRRCSPTRSSTAGATSRCSSSGTGAATCGSRCRTPFSPGASRREAAARRDPADHSPSRRRRRRRAAVRGSTGMRRRLEAVGGRLDVRRRTDPPTFTATAWVPVRVLS